MAQRKKAGRKTKQERPVRHPGRVRRYRPTLEALEERTLLNATGSGTFTWDMAPRTVADQSGRIAVPNTPAWVNPGTFEVDFHGSTFLIDGHTAASYSVSIHDMSGNTQDKDGHLYLAVPN